MFFFPHNLGQNIVKFEATSKTGFSMECFTAELSQYSNTIAKICLLGIQQDTCLQFKAFWGFYWNLVISKDPKFYVVRPLVRLLVYLLSGDNNLVSFQLLWRKVVPKGEKIYKYFVQNSRYYFGIFWIFSRKFTSGWHSCIEVARKLNNFLSATMFR